MVESPGHAAAAAGWSGPPTWRPPALSVLAWLGLLFLASAMGVLVIVAHAIGTFDADLSGNGDSSSHYVNGLLLRDYLAEALGRNPVAFAVEYYRNFPRVTIGHWPPGFYIFEGLLQLVFGRSVLFARLLQIALLAVLGTVAMVVVSARAGRVAGVLCGAALVLTPELLRLTNFIMADTFMAVLTLLTALAWASHAARPATGVAVAFAILALAAIMSKGNAIGLALLPPLHCALTGRWRVLFLARTWLAAAIVGIPAGIWYGLTYSTAADGYVYAYGIDYFVLAASFFAQGLLAQTGILLPVFIVAVIDIARRGWRGEAVDLEAALAASAIALLAFVLVMPVDTQVRYLVGVVPPVVMVAILFAARVLAAVLRSGPAARNAGLAALLAMNLAVVGRPPGVVSLDMHKVAATIALQSPEGAIVLALASPRGEGGLIAAFAEIGDRRHFVVRGTKLLSRSTLMGENYATTFASEADAQAVVTESPIDWIVWEVDPEGGSLPHVEQMVPMLLARAEGLRLHSTYRGSAGEVHLFHRPELHTPPTVRDAFTRRLGPTKFVQ